MRITTLTGMVQYAQQVNTSGIEQPSNSEIVVRLNSEEMVELESELGKMMWVTPTIVPMHVKFEKVKICGLTFTVIQE